MRFDSHSALRKYSALRRLTPGRRRRLLRLAILAAALPLHIGAASSVGAVDAMSAPTCTTPNIADVVGVPDLADGAGGVEVRLADGSRRLVTRETMGLGAPRAGDHLGAATKLERSSQEPHCVDVWIGAPGFDGSGALFLLRGTMNGFTARPAFTLRMPDPRAGDRFGETFAAGCLCVGAPGRDVAEVEDAGAVVVFGYPEVSSTSPVPSVMSVLVQGDGLPGAPEPGDQLGEVLEAGALGVFVGAPHEDVGSAIDGGAVYYWTMNTGLYGGPTAWTQNSAGMPGVSESGDHFEASIADAFDVVAIGVPDEDLGDLRDAGAVEYLHVTWGDHHFDVHAVEPAGASTQGSPGMPGAVEGGDRFGAAIAPLRGSWVCTDPRGAIFAFGAPGEDIGSVTDAGAVTLWDFGATDLTASASSGCEPRTLVQGVALGDVAETGDGVGAALSLQWVAREFNTEPPPVLNIGVPGEDVGTHVDAGKVHRLRAPHAGSGAGRSLAGGPIAEARYGAALGE